MWRASCTFMTPYVPAAKSQPTTANQSMGDTANMLCPHRGHLRGKRNAGLMLCQPGSLDLTTDKNAHNAQTHGPAKPRMIRHKRPNCIGSSEDRLPPCQGFRQRRCLWNLDCCRQLFNRGHNSRNDSHEPAAVLDT